MLAPNLPFLLSIKQNCEYQFISVSPISWCPSILGYINYRDTFRRVPFSLAFSTESLFHKQNNMQNDKGQNVELYIPRRW